MISKILTVIVLLLMTAPVAQTQERGRGQRGQRGTPQRAAPAPYYGGGVYGPGRRPGPSFDQRWRGAPGRSWRGRYYPPGVGPCWTYLPIVGWSWTCGP